MRGVFLLAAALAVSVLASDDVQVLTDANFDSELKGQEVVLVKFYAPWCGHCKKLAPEFDKAAPKLKANDPPIGLAKVDCTVEKEVCEKYGIKGYPTLKIFRSGQLAQEYDGPRDEVGIIKFMRGQAGPSAKEITSVAEYDKFVNQDDSAVFGFFETESKLKDSFFKVADTERDRFRFGYSTNADVLKKAGYTDDIVVIPPKKLNNKFDPAEFKYDGNYDTDKIKTFLISESNGLAGVRTTSNTFQFEARPLVVVYYNVDYVKDPKGSNYWRNRVLKVAQEYKRKLSFAVSAKEEFGGEIEQAGLGDRKESDKPIVVYYDETAKYPMDMPFSIDNLKQFITEVEEGNVEAWVKSEPVPEEQGDLKVLVGKNFKSEVFDKDQDALIEFYAPWCGHCKTLAPKYEELATKLAKENVIIAKMDATANDAPPMFEVKGFPTLYWLPKGDKRNPVPYNGGREVDDFVKFIARMSTDGLKGYNRDGKKKKKSEL